MRRWTDAELPKLPPLPKDDALKLGTAEPNGELDARKRECQASAVPHVDAQGSTWCQCARCGEMVPWWTTMWGRWNSEIMTVIVAPPKPGTRKWRRFEVPAMITGRVCRTTCAMELKEFRSTAEPATTIRNDAETRRHQDRSWEILEDMTRKWKPRFINPVDLPEDGD